VAAGIAAYPGQDERNTGGNIVRWAHDIVRAWQGENDDRIRSAWCKSFKINCL
jgi:hypothetical protein